MSLSQELFGFVGAGAVARALASALVHVDGRVVSVCSRKGRSARDLARALPGCTAVGTPQEVADSARVIVLAIPDDAVTVVAGAVRWTPCHTVLHCSGALGLDALAPARRDGARVGSLHPLQTFPRTLPTVSLEHVACAVEGDGGGDANLTSELEALVRQLGGRPFRVPPEARPLYHASAVLACAGLVTLVHQASSLWRSFGYTEQEALERLLPLLRGTVDALERQGAAGALTGPIARGDVETVRRHRAALAQAAPEADQLYRALALQTVPLALDKGTLTRGQADALQRVLQRRGQEQEDDIRSSSSFLDGDGGDGEDQPCA